MNSFRSSYAGSIARPLFGPPLKVCPTENPKNVSDPRYAQDLYRYQILYDRVLSEMNKYLTLFTKGEYDKLRAEFTPTKFRSLLATNNNSVYYNQTVTDLKNFKYNPSLFQFYRNNVYSVLTGFSLAVKQNETLENNTIELNEKITLLSSKEQLIEYIRKELSDTMMMDTFHITQTYNATAVLKPWFMRYLQVYGAPYDGVFDADKMATVVELLIQEKVITMEEFLQNQSAST